MPSHHAAAAAAILSDIIYTACQAHIVEVRSPLSLQIPSQQKHEH